MSWPVTSQAPSARDTQLRESLKDFLNEKNLLDDPDRVIRRQRAVQEVENICRRWVAFRTGEEVRKFAYVEERFRSKFEQAVTAVLARDVFTLPQEQGRIVLHGSVAFDAQLRTSDIDAIFICPNSISNEEFFRGIPVALRENVLINKVDPITNAKWPIIKLRISDEFDMDLQPLICKLNSVPDDIGKRRVLLASEMLTLFAVSKYDALRPMRITQFIDDALAETSISMAEYRLALQALKYWAKQNNIYGFDRFRKGAGLSGLSWTLLLVFVCQHNPQANCAVTLLRQVMKLFGQDWPWPRAVCLRLVGKARANYGGEYAPSAHGQYSNMPTEKGLMPIMTPLPETANRIDLIKYSHEKQRITSALQRAAIELRNVNDSGVVANFWDKFFVQSYK